MKIRPGKLYVMQYIVLPIILVGSDVVIGMMGHYSGTVGIFNIFSLEHFIDYVTNHTFELFLFLVIALIIALYVEVIINQIDRRA